MKKTAIDTEVLKSLLDTHPTVERFHFTSDGQAFIEKHHADAHAPTLEDKSVRPVSRFVFEKLEEVKAIRAAKQAGEPQTPAENNTAETETGAKTTTTENQQ